MALTIDQVFRDFNSPNVPGSGDHQPVKPEIRALLKQIQNSGGMSITRNTLTQLNAVTPPNENYMGIVLTGPEAGYYSRVSGAWVFGRGFPDSVAVWTQTGGTPNALQVSMGGGIDPAGVVLSVLVPTSTNSAGGTTISVSGGPAEPLLSSTGAPLASGELVAGQATAIVRVGGQLRLLFNPVPNPFRYAWSSVVNYTTNDIVQSGGSLWIARRPNLNVTPVDGLDWALYLPGATVADGSVTLPKLSPELANLVVNGGRVPLSYYGLPINKGSDCTAEFVAALIAARADGVTRLAGHPNGVFRFREAMIPEGSFDIDWLGGTILAEFNTVNAPNTTANAIRANMMHQSWGTNIGNMTAAAGLPAAFDGWSLTPSKVNIETLSKPATACAGIAALSGWVGKTWDTDRQIFRVRTWGSNDNGYIIGADPVVTVTIYGKAGATPPSGPTDGVVLLSTSFTDTANESFEREWVVPSKNTKWRHAWVVMTGASGTALRIAGVKFEGAASYYDFKMSNFVLDGQYNPAVTLNGQEYRVLDIEGYRMADIPYPIETGLARGGSTTQKILWRSDRHTNIHNCRNVRVEGAVFDGNARVEELVIQSTDEATTYEIVNCRWVNHTANGSACSVFNCAPGVIRNNFIRGFSGSGMNILSKYAEVCHNEISNITNSSGIDLQEGLYYAHGAHVHHNRIYDCTSIGINAGGSGLRIVDNTIDDCLHGISVVNALSVVNPWPYYGDWLTNGEAELSDIVIGGNRFPNGSNKGSDVNNTNIRVFGTVSFPVNAEIRVADEAYPAVKTENNIWLRRTRDIEISGKMMHGRTALVYVDQPCDTIRFAGVIFEPELTQTVNGVVAVGVAIQRVVFEESFASATFDAGNYHVTQSGGGSFGEIDFIKSETVGTTGWLSLPANTRVLRDTQIYVAATPFAITGTLTGAAGARLTQTLAVPGVRNGIDEKRFAINVGSGTTQFPIMVDAFVSADNTVTIAYVNLRVADIANPSTNLRLGFGPRGYS